jgi:DNA gyrase subunit B
MASSRQSAAARPAAPPDDTREVPRAAYDAEAITVLEGLEPVRKRPGMYVGSTGLNGLHHLIWEVVDNAVDEAMAGACTRIVVTINADGSCTVDDDGRGIPIDPYTKGQHKGKSTLEVVLTVLHAGGKFEGKGYQISGGLHGVGVSVVNALSTRLVAEVDRGGTRWRQEFRDGGTPKGKIAKAGPSPEGRTSGTRITFWPDPEIFESEGVDFVARRITTRLETIAYLNRGIEMCFRDERKGKTDERSFKFDGGIVDMVRNKNASNGPLFERIGHYAARESGQSVEVALQWNRGYNESIEGYANGISTTEGGMHVEGFKTAVTAAVNKFARETKELREKDENLLGEDVREGLFAVVAVRLRDPQFEGQTKSKLGNVSMRSFVQRETNARLEEWLLEHPQEARLIVKKAISAAEARIAAKNAKNAIRRKTSLAGAGMPDKLKDCQARSAAESEIFIVEGDSAGGTAVDARDPRTQAILPIRGKILNVERSRLEAMVKNTEIQTLVLAIGGGLGNAEFDADKARYHKVIILADADVDGSHIRTLLLTFFYRQMRPMVERGFIYIAQPPLYSTEVGKDKVYLKDDGAKAAFMKKHPAHKKEFQRLKGLGEMDWQELKSTTMDPATRTLLQVTVEEAAEADAIMSVLMGDDVEQRKEFITRNARDVRNLDF